ncbi:MAG: hypothetical protein UY57_C0041G0011, partial [Candidatus Kaiserbacteria bacterium GW2011_GWB1_50_17]
EIIVACIVLAVALLSYGLGYLSAKDAARAPIIIETRTSELQTADSSPAASRV